MREKNIITLIFFIMFRLSSIDLPLNYMVAKIHFYPYQNTVLQVINYQIHNKVRIFDFNNLTDRVDISVVMKDDKEVILGVLHNMESSAI